MVTIRTLTTLEAKAMAGEMSLDYRKRYATDGVELLELAKWTGPCSGCTEEPYPGEIVGSGCHECGYTGKRRHAVWVKVYRGEWD